MSGDLNYYLSPELFFFCPRTARHFRTNCFVKPGPSHWVTAHRPRLPGQEAAVRRPMDGAEGRLPLHQ